MLTGTQVTDTGLTHIKGLTRLQHLNLCRTAVTDAGLEHLKGLTQLVFVELADTQVTGPGLEHLKGLDNCREVKTCSKTPGDGRRADAYHWIVATPVVGTLRDEATDARLESVKGLTHLRGMNLACTD